MASSTTLTLVRDQVRKRGDFRPPFLPDDELDSYIKLSFAALYDIVILHEPETYLASTNINITAGTDTYNLPADFYISMGLERNDGSGTYTDIQPLNWNERHNTSSISFAAHRGSGVLKLHPSPDWNGSVRLWYIPSAPELTSQTAINTINSNQEWVINNVLCIVAGKEGATPDVEMMLKSEAERRIISASNTHSNTPKQVAGVNSRYYRRY